MINVALVFGGLSSEREVSIKTSESIKANLISINELNLFEFDFKENCNELLKFIENNNIDIVFNALHGGFGENGGIQSFLESNDIKFTGSDSDCSKIAINKHLTKKLCIKNSLPTPKWDFYNTSKQNLNHKYLLDKYNDSMVIKPVCDGSSVGMSIIQSDLDEKKITDAIIKVNNNSDEVLIEEYINGREITVGIIDGIALPIVEIIPDGDFYDYDSKYTSGMSKYIVPAKISEDLEDEIHECAESLYELINCRHYARVDFILDKDDNFYILEINTLPGLTQTSLLPKAYANEFNETLEKSFKLLVLEIIKLALK